MYRDFPQLLSYIVTTGRGRKDLGSSNDLTVENTWWPWRRCLENLTLAVGIRTWTCVSDVRLVETKQPFPLKIPQICIEYITELQHIIQ